MNRTKEIGAHAKRWTAIRNDLIKNKVISPTAGRTIMNENRQEQEMRKLGMVDDDIKGHDKENNIPIGGGDPQDTVLGLSDFPKDVPKGKGVFQPGVHDPEDKTYGGTKFKDLDERQVAEREHFNNEKYLHYDSTPISESANFEKAIEDRNYGITRPEKKSAEVEALQRIIGLNKTAADEDDLQVRPVVYKDVKTLPKMEGFEEPAVVDRASGKVKEAITKMFTVKQEIQKLESEMKEKTAGLASSLMQLQKPYNDAIIAQKALLTSYLDMLFDQLMKTDAQIVAYEDSLISAFTREKYEASPPTLVQLIFKADQIAPEIAKEIRKIKAILENENMKHVLEQFVYNTSPIPKVWKDKVTHASIEDSSGMDELLDSIKASYNSLKALTKSLYKLNAEHA